MENTTTRKLAVAEMINPQAERNEKIRVVRESTSKTVQLENCQNIIIKLWNIFQQVDMFTTYCLIHCWHV